jgi:Protein of unknown function (DUF3341)
VSPERAVLGSFAEPRRAAGAVRALRSHGFGVRAGMPAPFPEVMRALARPKSPVAFLALPGATVGIACGLLLTVLTSLSWRLVTGGKPIVSIPPFVVISFELSVLVGALANLAAVALGTWRGGRRQAFPVPQLFDGDRIGILAAGGDPALAARILRDSGADEVADVP